MAALNLWFSDAFVKPRVEPTYIGNCTSKCNKKRSNNRTKRNEQQPNKKKTKEQQQQQNDPAEQTFRKVKIAKKNRLEKSQRLKIGETNNQQELQKVQKSRNETRKKFNFKMRQKKDILTQ